MGLVMSFSTALRTWHWILERNLDMMLLEEENNRIQYVLALAICNRGLDLLTRIFGLKTPLFYAGLSIRMKRIVSIIVE